MKCPRKASRVGTARPLTILTRVGFALLIVACGSRTGLFGTEDDGFERLPDGGIVPRGDASIRDSSVPETLPPIDAQPPRDANRDDCPDAAATLIYVVTQEHHHPDHDE